MTLQRVQVVDSHTEGEPTRVIVGGGPDLGGGTVAAQAQIFRDRFDHFRAAVVNEPRGGDAWVGALIVPPANPNAVCGVIFFNNVGLLHACGHGTIGLGATLAHLGKIQPGRHLVETPVGEAAILLDGDGGIRIENVPAYRHAHGVGVEFEWNGRAQRVQGDIAWGGNWFFLVSDHGQVLELRNVETLTQYAWALRQGLERAGITGRDGAVIDHVELFGPPMRTDCDSRNFVLCPGKAYDRSPCGTGTGAKMACLFADGKLAEGQEWRQESILGSRFVGTIRRQGDVLLPTIQGHAYITAEGTLHFDPRDPFRHGIQS